MEAESIFYSFLALAFVIGLIGLTATGLRYFGGDRFLKKGLKLQKDRRLKIVDFLVIDQKRKLLIIQRDDVEHLLLIGGDRETVVETNIKKTKARK